MAEFSRRKLMLAASKGNGHFVLNHIFELVNGVVMFADSAAGQILPSARLLFILTARTHNPELRNGNCGCLKARHHCREAQSGAQALAVQTLARSLVRHGQHEAFGLRAIYRRSFPTIPHPIRRQYPA
jgi:hypothetical protein